jgi:hypothetical protein
LTPGDLLHLGLPVVFEPDDKAHVIRVARPEAG